MIDDERLRQMFYLFGLTLPLGDEMKNEAFKALFGGDSGLREIVPVVLNGICEQMILNKEASEGYLDFMIEAMHYAKCDSDELPTVEGKTADELKIILQHR